MRGAADGASATLDYAFERFGVGARLSKTRGVSTALVLSVATSRRNRFVPNEGAADSQGRGCRRAAIPKVTLGVGGEFLRRCPSLT